VGRSCFKPAGRLAGRILPRIYQLSQIILWVLWTIRPVMAVETSLIDIIEAGFAAFEDEATLDWMDADPANCAEVSAGLVNAHAKLDLLIHLRACEIAGLAHRTRAWRPIILPHHSDRTAEACWRRFSSLVLRFEQVERLAQLRAAKLTRHEASELPPAVRAFSHSLRPRQDIPTFMKSCLTTWGRWIATPSSRDGSDRQSTAKARGCALARAPPSQLSPISASPTR
jgi:hypothetical protein